MAGSKRGGKSPKSEKSATKKHGAAAEDTPTLEEKKEEEAAGDGVDGTADDPNAPSRMEGDDQGGIDGATGVTAEAETFADEPSLTEHIIDKYEGEKERGHFEGYGVAYFTNTNTYEGSFTKGMMHGKGKYTWTQQNITYEGGFYQNQITGKGLYSWSDGSTYDGDVVNGIRHGRGTFRHPAGLSFTGQWDNGKRHGEGRLEYDAESNSFYDGEWRNGIRHGMGYRQYPSGNVYEGTWFCGLRHGQGVMRWVDRNEMYTGQWEDGIQHGMGQHIWFIRRVKCSQYPLRNVYDGEFVKGRRHGYGVFYYPNGARYEGHWVDNLKCGQGKFVFKNGRVYEGEFENDRIKEFPDFSMNGRETPDISCIRTSSPTASFVDGVSVHSSITTSPNFQLYIDHLLMRIPDNCDSENESNQVTSVLLRHYGCLRRVYNFYSALGNIESQDNTFVMNQMQFWRFMKDCKFHHQHDISLTDIDRFLAEAINQSSALEIHNPTKRVLFLEFINHIVTLSFHLHGKENANQNPFLSSCLTRLIIDNILPCACLPGGFVFSDLRKSTHAMMHIEKAYTIYQRLCSPQEFPPFEPVFKMRQFLYMFNEFKMINKDLTPTVIVSILSADDPQVADADFINMEREMTFLEFFEALVGCAAAFVTAAVIKDPNTPRTDKDDKVSTTSRIGTPSNADVISVHADSPVPADTKGDSKGDDKSHHGGDRGGSRKGAKGGKHHDPKHAPAKTPAPPAEKQSAPDNTYTAKEEVEVPPPVVPEVGPVPAPPGGVSAEEMAPMTSSTTTRGAWGGAPGTANATDSGAEELDKETREFNFWTHQVHIFFVRKLFPAAERFFLLEDRVEARRRLEEAAEERRLEQEARDLQRELQGTDGETEVATHFATSIASFDDTSASPREMEHSVPIQVAAH